MDLEVVLALPDPIPPVAHVRSTVLLGSIAAIEAADMMDEYVAAAPVEVRTAITTLVAGMWVPVETALAHYRACDRMPISSETAANMGRSVFIRTKGMLLGAAIGLARSSGATPWTMVPHLQRFWLRGVDGGGVGVTALGPKEVRIDIVGCPLFETRYFRDGCLGLFTSFLELVSQKGSMHELPADGAQSMSLRAQWV